jgi:hypothetical protein
MAESLRVAPTLSDLRDRLRYNGFAWIDGFRHERLNNAYAEAVTAELDALQDEDVFLGLSPRAQYDLAILRRR